MMDVAVALDDGERVWQEVMEMRLVLVEEMVRIALGLVDCVRKGVEDMVVVGLELDVGDAVCEVVLDSVEGGLGLGVGESVC